MLNWCRNLLIGNHNNIQRAGYLWNTAAGLINASQAVVLLMVITRTNGFGEAGILTIAFAVANLMVNIGKFGMRNYQITDIKEQFSFSTYLRSRILTSTLMVAACCGYVLYHYRNGTYLRQKAEIVFLICILYAMDSIEDVFWGRYQQKGRLDIGAKIYTIRWCIILAGFIGCLFLNHNLKAALLTAVFASIVCLYLLLWLTIPAAGGYEKEKSSKRIFKLLQSCTPLFLSGFCSFYIANAPKYEIDKYLTDEIQACYGFVAMPVFAIGLLNGFIYQPTLIRISYAWVERRLQELAGTIKKQLAAVVGITFICLIAGYWIGIPVLSILYGVKLDNYKRELLLLLLGGGTLAAAGYFNVIITVMRKQKILLICYIGASITAKCCMPVCVRTYGTIGAATMYLLIMLLLVLLFGGYVYRMLSVPSST